MTFFSLPRNRKITLCEEHFEESCFSKSVDLGRRLMKSKGINLYLISFLIYNIYWPHFPCSFTFWVKLLAIYFTANGLPRILLMDSSQPYFPTRNKKNNKKRDFSTSFLVNFSEFLGTPFFKNTYGGCFWRWEHNETKLLHTTSRLNKCYLRMIRFELFWQPVEMGR